jgi:hypothetical protein
MTKIKLPPLPRPDCRLPMDGPPRYREDQLRALQLETARMVLEAAANLTAAKARKYDGDMEGADHDEFIAADWAAGAMRQLLKELRALCIEGEMP